MSKTAEPAVEAEPSTNVFSWVKPALKSRRTVKTWIRCCVVLAATMVLVVDNKSLASLGQAAFFAAIVAVMLPPSLALSLFIFASVTLLLGMVIGWAWSCAAMASGFSVRSPVLLAQQQQQAQASLVQGEPSAIQLQRFIFQGMFLDPGTSAIYGAFFFIGTFALGTLRAFIPKLTLLSIFGCIVMDIMCTYGPLFPTLQYTLARLFLVPACYYVAIAIASLILIFPESLNHVWLTSLGNGYLDPILKILSIQSEALTSQPSDRKKWAELNEKTNESKLALTTGTQGLIGQIGMIDLEFSVGRLGPGDLKKISAELKSLTFRAAGLHAFQVFVNNTNGALEKEEAIAEKQLHSGNATPSTDNRYTTLLRQIREREAKHGHDFDDLVPILQHSSADLREACEAAVKGAADWFQDCNTGRWAGLFSKTNMARNEERHQRLVGLHAVLLEALNQFREVDRVKIIKPYERFFDPETGRLLDSVTSDKKGAEMFAARSLFVCFVFSYALDAFADRLAKILAMLIKLDGKRPKPRIWTPSGFGKLGRKIMSKQDVDDTVVPIAMGTSNDPTKFTSDEDDDEVDEEMEATTLHKNPDALPPTTVFGRAFRSLGAVLRFFKSPEGIFGFRMGIVSVALWIPSICTSTAWFYYANRGLWALIMAQTGLAVYAGDQIAGYLVRLAGTGLGLLFGMAIWYMGAGHGDGNPYGIVIATTFLTAFFILGRLAAPAQQMMLWTLSSVTIVFVVGYSWINTHLPVLVSSGVGAGLGWKRALLVIIGFTAGFIVMMFPRPTSSRTLVRQTLAATVGELGHILTYEVEALLAEEARARAGHLEKIPFVGEKSDEKASPKERRVRKIATKVLAVAARLQGLAPSLKTARFEPQLQGTWPHEKYERLFSTQTRLLSSLIIFTGAFSHLDTKWCSILVHRTPFLNPNLLSDIFSNISILSYALAGAHPLPGSLPVLRDRVIYHERLLTHTGSQLPLSKKLADSDSETDQEENGELEFGAGKVDGSSIGFEELSLDVLMDDQLPAHSTALVALSNVISMVDEMSIVVRELCGETTFRGFDALRRDFLGREEKAIGGGMMQRVR